MVGTGGSLAGKEGVTVRCWVAAVDVAGFAVEEVVEVAGRAVVVMVGFGVVVTVEEVVAAAERALLFTKAERFVVEVKDRCIEGDA